MPFFILKEKPFTKKWFISHSLILIGSFILASGFVLFITPYKIVPGGVYGISISAALFARNSVRNGGLVFRYTHLP
jgi:uncharacterized membrane-anchored protein YitT (DUF2179 family)